MAIVEARQAEDRESDPLRVQAVFWNSLGPGSVAYALTELLDNLPADLVERKLWCLGRHPESPRDYHSPSLPGLVLRALNKARVPAPVQGRLAREVALRSIESRDIVYMWPPYDLPMIKRAQERGAIIVAERTNCMGAMGREVLASAYARRGTGLPKGWFPAKGIAEERQQMLQCDFVTAANPLVTQSLRDAGVPQGRILETSYGFSPERLAAAIDVERPKRRPVFAFVGLGIVRKGFDVLLEAWQRASVDGTLLIAGHIDDGLRDEYTQILTRPDVHVLGWVKDISSVYTAADVFVFPTHEEGGPQVVYEAAGCGLASIVSPMGAGRIIRHGSEGLIVDPLQVDNLAAAITRLAEDSDLRRAFGGAAAVRAREFTWARVGRRLYDQFYAIRRDPHAPAALHHISPDD
jgi:glycosyltransferase involved in cell wall biosynthesis